MSEMMINKEVQNANSDIHPWLRSRNDRNHVDCDS